MVEHGAADWAPGDPIGYVTPEIPDFQMSPYCGERYEAMVPDTLDLAERARLAIHAMTENPNPQADYEPYWRVHWLPIPRMTMDFASPTITPKFQEATVLARLMSGSDQNLHVDRRWAEVTLMMQGSDGLFWIPVNGRPWAYASVKEYPHHYGGVTSGDLDASAPQILSPFVNGQHLLTMSLYAARDGGTFWDERIRNAVDGLASVAVDRGDYSFFWPGPLWASASPPPGVRPRFHFHLGEMSLAYWGTVRAYKRTGYEPALTLARKLVAFHRDTFFTREGAFVTPQPGSVKGHTHAHARGLRAMADLALSTSDDELLEFVVKSYEWARTKGERLTGFFPNHLPSPEWPGPTIEGEQDEGASAEFDSGDMDRCEPAGVASLVATAVRLSESGAGDYWDDIDRWVRNTLAESQMLDTEWVHYLRGTVNVPVRLGVGETIDRVPERNLGSWATSTYPNDLCDGPSVLSEAFVQGDTPNVTRALYLVWNSILRYADGKLKVNLLLNRASQWGDLDSYIPYEGRVEIRVKQPGDLAVRIPEWAAPPDVRVQVNGVERRVGWDGRYAHVGEVKPRDTATLSFPMAEGRVEVAIEKRKYRLARRGNEVVDVYPRGRHYPYYRREQYRRGQPRWRKVTRYVSDRPIEW